MYGYASFYLFRFYYFIRILEIVLSEKLSKIRTIIVAVMTKRAKRVTKQRVNQLLFVLKTSISKYAIANFLQVMRNETQYRNLFIGV